LHRQIYDLVRQEILTGRLAPGTRLPSEEVLATQLGVSLAPVRQAFADLAAEGLLDRLRGRGTFVQEGRFEEKLSILASFSEIHAAYGDQLELLTLFSGLVPAPREVATALGVRTRRLVLMQRLARLKAGPVALLSAYLDSSRFPAIGKQELEGGSLYQTLKSRYSTELVRATSVIEVVKAGDEEAAPLDVGTGAMLLRVDSVTYDTNDEAVEFSRVLYRMERFRFSLESRRVDGRVVHFPSSAAKRRSLT
jgi:DNA-binding GntR family transcriptional regulator